MNREKLKKSPIWPALLSALVAPGMGQIFNREFQKGFFLLLSSITSFIWFSKVLTERLAPLLPGSPEQWATDQTALKAALLKLINENSSMFITFQLLILLIWGFGVLDAYFTARKNLLAPAKNSNEDQNTAG